MLLAFICAFSALSVYVGVEGWMKPTCFIRCDAPWDVRSIQAFYFVLPAISAAALLFDALARRRTAFALVGIGLAIFIFLSRQFFFSIPFFMGAKAGFLLIGLLILYLLCLPHFLAVNALYSVGRLAFQDLKGVAICAGVAAIIVLVTPPTYTRWSIDRAAKKISPANYCLYQSKRRSGPVFTRDAFDLKLGPIIRISTPRVYLVSPAGIYEWRFRKLKFEYLVQLSVKRRLFGRPTTEIMRDCTSHLEQQGRNGQ